MLAVHVPAPRPRSGHAFVEFSRRHGDYALVGVAATAWLDDRDASAGTRIALLSVGDGPVPAHRAVQTLERRQAEVVDQSSLPGAVPMVAPRLGFNRRTQVRGGTGIFTGRVPFVWIGNVISNPGANPNLWSPFNTNAPQIPTSDNAILQQSFDLNAVDPDFTWAQVWTTDVVLDQELRGGWLGPLGAPASGDARATSPLALTRFDANGAPVFNFTGPAQTYIDDPGLLSRWRAQIGLRYLLN